MWNWGVGTKSVSSGGYGKGGNISNQAEMIKTGFRGKGEAFRYNRGFGRNERLGGEINDRMGGVGIEVGRGELKFGGRVAVM